MTTIYSFQDKDWKANSGGQAANWTSGKAGAGYSNSGIQVTTNSTGANGSSPVSFTNVTKIVVTYNTNKSKGAGTVVAQVGNNSAITNNVSYSGSADGTSAKFTTEFNYATPQTGKVKLTVNTKTNSIYLVSVAITTTSGSSVAETCATPAFTPIAGTYLNAQNVTISTTTDGATIYYTTDGSAPTTSSSVYSNAVNISSTTTLKAVAVKDGMDNSEVASATYKIVTIDHAGTEADPYTVADARTILDAGLTPKGVYVKGIVSGIVSAYNSQYENISYNISDDGTTTADQLQAFRGKSYDGENFTSESDIQVKDAVVVKGDLILYNNSTYELAADNQLVSLVRPEKLEAGLAFAATAVTAVRGEAFTAPALTNPNSLAVVYSSSDEAVAKVDAETGAVTLLKAGETVISASFAGDADYKAGEASYALTVTVPSHKATIYVNGEKKSEAEIAEDDTITFPETKTEVLGKQFIGWTTAEIDGTTNDKPSTLVTVATMGTAAVTYYAVYANVTPGTTAQVDDKLSQTTTGVTGTSYTEWSGKTATSDAVYAGQSAGDKTSIQLRSNNSNSGVITTKSGGLVKKIVVDWNSNTIAGRTLNVYGSATAYSAATDLYNASKQGTLLGTVVCGTSTELVVNDDYAFIGFRSASGAMYLNSVSITWEKGIPETYSDYCTTLTLPAPVFSLAEGEYGEAQELTISCETEGAEIFYQLGDAEAVKYDVPITLDETTTVTAWAEKDGLKSETVSAAYTISIVIPEPVKPAAPIVFHDSGVYEDALTVPMYAQEGEIRYTLNGGAEQTYSAPVAISETTTVTAWTMLDGVKSDVVEKTFTIKEAEKPAINLNGYYSIKSADGKYVNVAGRKTVTFVSDNADKAGTVVKLETENAQVKVLRSQGVDLPGYAEKAMKYVPKVVKLVADKLKAVGSGTILGTDGLDAIMAKFDETFDEHLYLEAADGESYRIYGRTPSMKPVVDFYAENKANVDHKLPQLEAFINDAIKKVLEKTGGSGASILVPFSLETVWQNMGGTLTEPVDEASTARFYEEVLSSEENVWQFAYQTAMIYWGKLKDHKKFQEMQEQLGDYAKYINKVEYIRPNFKYYIVPGGSGLDVISEGNVAINNASSAWALVERTDFTVAFPEENVLNGKYYTTLYTDFAYTLPEGVKAYKVTEVNETSGVAKKVELEGTVPAQTPVLLESEKAEAQTLTLNTEGGTAPTDNLLKGPDYLIKTYEIKTAQVESLFDMAKGILGESTYNSYLAEYEHLMLRNAGTVNNKYFFGLTDDDLELCTYKNENNEDDCVVRSLSTGNEKLGFYNNWEVKANKAFLVSEKFNPVKLTLIGDINRDGSVTIADVNALVEIVLGKVTEENNPDDYDFEAAHVNADDDITIADVTALVNIILDK